MIFRPSRTPATTALLVVIAAVFALEFLNHAYTGDDGRLVAMGAITFDTLQRHQYWRLLTGMFLHAGVLHWLANSWTLFQLGSLYETMFGTGRFLLIYFVAGLCASVASAMHLPPGGTSVGASGAVLGILGAFFFSVRRSPQWRNERWTRSLLAQLLFWAALNLIIGLSVPQIDNTAHVAGILTGLVLGFLPHRVPPPPPSGTVIDVQPYEG